MRLFAVTEFMSAKKELGANLPPRLIPFLRSFGVINWLDKQYPFLAPLFADDGNLCLIAGRSDTNNPTPAILRHKQQKPRHRISVFFTAVQVLALFVALL